MGEVFDAKRIKEELVQWIADYFWSNGTSQTKAVIGISGGKDSSIVAALCKEAIGKERVLGVIMPQGYQDDIDIAYKLCETLDIPCLEINIQNAVQALYTEIENANLELTTVATFNTPARIRMATLYAVSGIVGGRVANTCNLSEDWVGYSTKFGDSAGDFSPLSDLTVTEVKEIGRELGLASIFIDKSPVDGLCGKTDEDNLGFTYAVLDRYIRENICANQKVKEKIDNMQRQNLHKLRPMPMYKLS
ncbi:MAG: NAD(+) synthase [Methanomicrobiales archaeon]|jgi:NAD+ synthase|nr:NAD(+) synthase [Methanomicrobiales archaeon]